MKLKKLYIAGAVIIAPLLLVGCDSDTRNLIANLPKDNNVLFWTVEQRDAAFRAMEKLVDYNEIKAGGNILVLPEGKPLDLDVTQYMKDQRTAGLIIIQDGKIRIKEIRNRQTVIQDVAKKSLGFLHHGALQPEAIFRIEPPVGLQILDFANPQPLLGEVAHQCVGTGIGQHP